MPALASLNGKTQSLADVMIPALDRGFLFGDAIYEVMHVVGGKPRFFSDHMIRLRRSLAEVCIGPIDVERLQARILETIKAGNFKEALVYIQITRGAAPTRSHAFPPTGTIPTEFFFVEEFKEPYGSLRETGVAVVTQPDIRWHRCDVKSVNLLGNILAYQAAKEEGAYEAILVRPDGTITEGARTSLFAVINGKIRTGPLSPKILPGVTRGNVLKLVKQLDLPCEEKHLHRDELPLLEELFLTGTTAELLPVIKVDGRPVGAGEPGPITKRLQQAFTQFVDSALLNRVEIRL
jgi:D-alanine transaminase